MKQEYRGFRDLIVYQLSYKLALEIFDITKSFPKEEKFSLVDQIRRSSRSIPSNLAEAWSKRRYPKAFISKLIDVDGECSETSVWLDFSKDQNYINLELYNYFIEKYNEISKMLNSMINKPDKFCY